MNRLFVHEIYLSIQGESSRAGLPCVIVRLAGCNLDCRWCDTPEARVQERQMTVNEILARVADLRCHRVEVTGGEPLTQPAALELLARLCESEYETMLETNGSIDVTDVDGRVMKVIDVKCPASGESDSNLWANLQALGPRDEVKFVIADREDYDYAREVAALHKLVERCGVIFSPVVDELPASRLAEWIIADRLDVRLGVQLHKIIWPDAAGGV
ncbi:MAG: radical SAM protein [Phycisphaerae bacterium]|nr:radical SAM protein [Phycisphaerae bacterium]